MTMIIRTDMTPMWRVGVGRHYPLLWVVFSASSSLTPLPMTPVPLQGENFFQWAYWVCWLQLQCRIWCWSPKSHRTSATWLFGKYKWAALTFLIQSISVFSLVQLIVHVNTLILVIIYDVGLSTLDAEWIQTGPLLLKALVVLILRN